MTGTKRITISSIILTLSLGVSLVSSWGYTSLTWTIEIVLLLFLAIYFLKTRSISVAKTNPNLIYFWVFVLFRCFIAGNFISSSTVIVILYVGIFCVKFNTDIDDYFINFLKIIGLIEALGVYFQFFLNSEYNLFYQKIFTAYSFDWIQSRYELYNYLSGFTSEVSQTAGFLGISLGAYIYDINKEKLKKWDITLIALIIIALILTGKRSQTFFSLLGIVVVYLASANSREKILRVIKILIAATALVVVMIYIYAQYGETNAIGRMVGYIFSLLAGEENTFGGRSGIWDRAIQLFLSRPLIGVGWNRFTNMIQTLYGETINSAHNVYLQLLCELGIIGFILFVCAEVSSVVMCINRLKKCEFSIKKKRNNKLLLYLYVFYFSYCFFGNCLNDLSYSMLFFPAIVVLQNRSEIK